jgi:hypothetical protein
LRKHDKRDVYFSSGFKKVSEVLRPLIKTLQLQNFSNTVYGDARLVANV